MFEWLSPDVELVRDVSVADWLVARLEPWSRDGVRLASFMPDGFDAYARVFHPLRYGQPDGEEILRSWGEVAAEQHVQLTPDSSIQEVLGLDPGDPKNFHPNASPIDGRIPKVICAQLVSLLAPHTRTPAVCWFGVWVGWGGLTGSSDGAMLRTGPGPSRRESRQGRSKAREADDLLASLPKVDGGHGRVYVLFRGALPEACGFGLKAPEISPSLWWPDDRAWVVATEIDGLCSYVGGSREAIHGLLDSGLETIEVTRGARML